MPNNATSGLLDLFEAHYDELLRFLDKRLDSSGVAADIAHDVYLRLRQMDKPPAIQDRRAYLFTMAANLAADHQRVEKRRGELLSRGGPVIWDHRDEQSAERHALAQAELDHLAAEVQQLPHRCREVFRLYRYEGQSQAAIAARLGIGVTTVYKDLKQVMAALTAARRRFHAMTPPDEHGSEGSHSSSS